MAKKTAYRLISTGIAASCLWSICFGAAAAQSVQAAPGLDDSAFPPLLGPNNTVEASTPASAPPRSTNPAFAAPELTGNTITLQKEMFDGDPAELMALIPPARNTGDEWRIYKDRWEKADELGYQAFVMAIGRSSCNTLDSCIRDKANPYRDLDDEEIYLGDCADMAYFLRAYYAWKNGLPFTYQHVMATADGRNQDLRYSDNGNIVIDRRLVKVSERSGPIDAPSFLQRIGGEVSTAMFRTHPDGKGSRTHDDFYPVAIDREHVVPGSVAYDVFGHVGLIYEITEDGRALIVASHPDMSVSRSYYGPNFLRTGPDHGGGIKAWRPIRLAGATRDDAGVLVGGHYEAAKNDELDGFSLVQYFGNGIHPVSDWQLSEFFWEGRTMQYYDYVRHALSAPGYRFDPVFEMRTAMEGLCSELRARRVAVDQAVRDKLHLQDHPGRLPPNIYGTYGTWESYSTPSRDARLKTGFRDLKRVVTMEVAEAGPVEGPLLAARLLHAYDEQEQSCIISYRQMDNTLVRLSFQDIAERLFDMSFDPYHCPERRWGARGAELATCQETEEKRAWYEAERYLRNQIDRTYDVPMGFTLDQMASPADAPPSRGGLGEAVAPDINTRNWLVANAAPHPATSDPLTASKGAMGSTASAGAGGN